MSYWWILAFAVLIFIALQAYDHFQQPNQSDQTDFSKAFNEANEPLYPSISSILTSLILGVILFFGVQYLRNVYS